MNELFAQLFGQSPSYANALFGEDEAARLRQQAQQQGLLNVGLSLLAGSGPSPQRRGVGQLLAQGVAAGQQAYQGAYDKAMRDRMIQEQIQEQQRARAEQQAAQALLPQILRPGATQEIYGEDIMGQRVGEGVRVMPPSIDTAALQQLLTRAPSVAAKVLPTVEALEKRLAPETREVGGVLYEKREGTWTPVAGTQKRNTVTVGNRVLDANTMQVLFTAPDAPAASIKEFQDFQKLTPQEQKSYISLQEQKRPTTTIQMPTGEERKAAVLAQRLNFSVNQMNQAIGQEPTAAIPNTAAEVARFFTGSEFLANKLNPEQRQVVEAAQLDVLDAALTLGTGAAYTREQLEGYRKAYFPQLGDKPEQIKTKRERLQNILESAAIASGRAASSIGAPMPAMQAAQTPGDLAAQARAELERRRGGQ
jgi:hypothetical protein